MKFGFRRPSIRRRISARTSPARYLRHNLGLKAPRGWGWITNPKRALYNRIYSRTTIDPLKVGRSGCLLVIAVPAIAALVLLLLR